MYILKTALTLPLRFNARWVEEDLGQAIVSTLFKEYREIVLLLEIDSEEHWLSLESLRKDYSHYPNTLTVLLATLDQNDVPLTFLAGRPDAEVHFVHYENATRVHYKQTLARRGHHVPCGFPEAELDDVEITRPDYPTQMELLHTHCLVSLNGYFHMTDTDGVRAYLVDGGKSARARNMNNIGISSFLHIGKLTKLPITDAMIRKMPNQSLKEIITLDLDRDLVDQSFFLVLGGYLLFPQEDVFWQSGERQYKLDLKRLPYIERLLESQANIDLSSLELSTSPTNPSMINLEEAWSDETVIAYLKLSQSYFVVVDTPNLFTNRVGLRTFNTPGEFTTREEPKELVQLAYGRTGEYWKKPQHHHWLVRVQDAFYRKYHFRDQSLTTLENVSDQLDSQRPFFVNQAYLLEIGSYS